MRKIFAIAGLWIVLGVVCGAEARWCSITGRAEGNDVEYPEIARQAMVFGVVKSRLTFVPDGEVSSIEHLSGPMLLFSSMKQQVLHWRIKTDAVGDQPCQAVMIATFNLDDLAQWRNPDEENAKAPSVVKITIDATSEPHIINVTISDPVIRPGGFRVRGSKIRVWLGKHSYAGQ